MDENKAELRASLERALRRPIPQAAWDKYVRDEWIDDFYEKRLDHRGEVENFRALRDAFAKELEYLDQIEQEKVQAAEEGHETQSADDVPPDQYLNAESQYFEVELGSYERERQRAFAEVIARNASKNKQVVSFRRNYLGGRVLTPDQAYAFLKSPAARYFAADLFLELQIPAAEHRAEIVDRYERLRDAPNDVDHRVTVRVHPPGVTMRVRYARPGRPVTDGDQIDVRHCVFKGTKREALQTPDDVLLRYRGWDGVREVAYIWPGSMLDGLRYASSRLAKMYSWKEEDAVWFFLTDEAPSLSALTLNARFDAGNLMTISMAAVPWISAETIKKNYLKVQGQVLIKGNHALSLRSIAVLRFVEKDRRERSKQLPWRELLDRWNQEHPEWKYRDYRGLRQTYCRTLNTIVHAPVRLPESKPSPRVQRRSREALERAKEIVELDSKRGSDEQSEI